MNDFPRRSAPWIVSLIVVSAAVVGYFTGIQSPMNPGLKLEHPPVVRVPFEATTTEVIPAVRWDEMDRTRFGPNAGFRTDLSQLPGATIPPPPVDAAATLPIPSQEQKQLALAIRASRRAYNGAPPTIPHPVQERADVACAACHAQGSVSASLRIPRMSHPMYANCTQCHVPASSEVPTLVAAPNVENTFAGLPAPTGGPRAYANAPPQIPHATWMRQNCLSCHGPAGLKGMQTSHPWRQNCLQCHAPAAALEQTGFANQ